MSFYLSMYFLVPLSLTFSVHNDVVRRLQDKRQSSVYLLVRLSMDPRPQSDQRDGLFHREEQPLLRQDLQQRGVEDAEDRGPGRPGTAQEHAGHGISNYPCSGAHPLCCQKTKQIRTG